MDSKKIASKLIELRGEKTQQQVADDIGISVSAITNYELGIRVPRDEIKIRLADYYGVSVESIFFSQSDTERHKKGD